MVDLTDFASYEHFERRMNDIRKCLPIFGKHLEIMFEIIERTHGKETVIDYLRRFYKDRDVEDLKHRELNVLKKWIPSLQMRLTFEYEEENESDPRS